MGSWWALPGAQHRPIAEWPAGPSDRDITGPSWDPAYCLDHARPEAQGCDGSQMVPIPILQRKQGPPDRPDRDIAGPSWDPAKLSRPSKSGTPGHEGSQVVPILVLQRHRGPQGIKNLMGSWPGVHGLMAHGCYVVLCSRASPGVPSGPSRMRSPWQHRGQACHGGSHYGGPHGSPGNSADKGSAAVALPAGPTKQCKIPSRKFPEGEQQSP